MDRTTELTVEPLQDRAVREDTESCQALELGWLFAGLVGGTLKVVCEFQTDERCYLVFRRLSAGRPPEPLPERHRAVLEQTLLRCPPQKVTASDVGCSISSISSMLKAALHFMGLSCGASRVPVLLVLAARGHVADIAGATGRLSGFVEDGVPYWVVSVSRPDLVLKEQLPRGEYEVARLLVEGRTHQEIASLRRTSLRTVANQLGSVFHRLDVSGRLELLHYVVTPRKVAVEPAWFVPRKTFVALGAGPLAAPSP